MWSRRFIAYRPVSPIGMGFSVLGLAAVTTMLMYPLMVLCAGPRMHMYPYHPHVLIRQPTDDEIDEQIRRLEAMKAYNRSQSKDITNDSSKNKNA
jgi:hypothetical protein